MLGRMPGNAGQRVGQPGLRVDIVHLGRDDQAVHHRRALPATIRAAEQPRLPAEGDAPQRALGRVVRDANSAIVEEPGERRPAPQHVVDGAGDVVAARKLGPFSRSQSCRLAMSGADKVCRAARRSSALRPLILRSISNKTSMRCTASRQIGDSTAGALAYATRRALPSTSASTKNFRRACAQHAALRIGPGLRPGS